MGGNASEKRQAPTIATEVANQKEVASEFGTELICACNCKDRLASRNAAGDTTNVVVVVVVVGQVIVIVQRI